ncbi:MAG TPA: PQQ-binding-like beta-propeller repeat protein, partial [Vicinamibacterales bacterium]|nr:PQQ-binding-like beta-propeller repeat protein [Vicinamibacterales bacterium]
PQAGEPGNETWEDDSWRRTGNTNVWTVMSADEELGYVYLPTSTPTNDWYGGHRLGDNLFAESLVCLNARTGERVWHFQMVRHGIWDYDLPAAPNLVDIVVDGRQVKAVAQVSKQGWVYVFDRVTGEPVWPIFDRPVPASSVPGEKTSPTQPFPSWPLPFEHQGVSENDLIDFTPELRAEALELLSDVNLGPLFTPFSLDKGLLYAPGPLGGANWTGAAFDPDTHVLYVPSINWPMIFKIVPADPAVSDADYAWEFDLRFGPQGLPFVKPPYGSVTAIDLDTGEHLWRAPLGEGPRNHPALRDLDLPRLGWPLRGAPLLTPDLLLVGQEARHWAFVFDLIGGTTLTETQETEMTNFHPRFFAYDKNTGELLFEMELPQNVTGAPMTYMAHGRQYVVFATGGIEAPANLTALALPSR